MCSPVFQFVLIETVTTSVMDRFPKLRNYKLLTVIALCSFFFLLGLTLTTNVSILFYHMTPLLFSG